MPSTQVMIIYPADFLGPKVGGVETILKGFIKYAPLEFEITFIGITSNAIDRPVGKLSQQSYGGRNFNFYPLFFEKNENKRSFFPLSMRFTFALMKASIPIEGVLFFHRIEPIIALRGRNNSKICFIHNDIEQQIKTKGSEVLWRRFPWLYFALERFIFKACVKIFTVNRKTLGFYQQRYPRMADRFKFVPTWVDLDIFHPLIGERLELRCKLQQVFPFLDPKKKWILFVGRLQEQKAPLRLIDALHSFCEEGRGDAHLIIIGDGNLRDSVKMHIQSLGLEKNAFVISYLEQSVLAEFYKASDVLLLTSHFEGMPCCVLEALGCGLPVVTTDVGEVRRVVIDGFSGEIVMGFEPKAIACAIKKVLDNPSHYPLQNCIKSIEEYTPLKVLSPLYNYIKEVAEREIALR